MELQQMVVRELRTSNGGLPKTKFDIACSIKRKYPKIVQKEEDALFSEVENAFVVLVQYGVVKERRDKTFELVKPILR